MLISLLVPRMKNFREIRWLIRLTWAIAPYVTSGLVITTLARSLFPAALVLVSRELVNALIMMMEGTDVATNRIWWWLAAGFGVTVLEVISNGVNLICKQSLTDALNIRISTDIMQQAAQLDLPFFESASAQDRVERLRTSATAQIANFLSNALELIMNAIQLVTLLTILLAIEPLISLLLLVIAVPYAWFQWYLAHKRYQVEIERATKKRWSKYFVWISMDYEWVPEIKLLNLSPVLIAKFHELLKRFRKEDQELYRLDFVGNTLYGLYVATSVYTLFVLLINRVLANSATIGDVAIYGGATVRLRTSFQNMIQFAKSMREQLLYLADVYQFLQIQSPQRHTESAPCTVTLPRVNSKLTFENVSFTYADATEPALANLSFCIEPGETVALVGENGAGKSTLAKLIARLYAPTAGTIRFGGIDIASFSVADWQRQVSFVFQNYSQYEATAAENIAYGNWEEVSAANVEQVQTIARRANVADLIESMPHGYATPLGRRFSKYTLSQGQWQKLAIARAFARQDSHLFILDEPTASLDARAEYELFEHFRTLAAGRTTILISHRFSTVRVADRILVLRKGRIVESGSHEELLQRNGQYAALYRLYQRE